MNQQNHSAQREVNLPRLTLHAKVRMQQRGIRDDDIEQVVRFGRRIHAKGLTYYVVGRKEVKRQALVGKDIAKLEGLQVLVEATDGMVVTTYRSKDFHSIRSTPRDRCRRYSHDQH